MSNDEMIALVKTNLGLTDDTKDLIISDVIQNALNHCNLKELPAEAEPYIRRKTRTVINYEVENGTGAASDVKSIREGDTTITYNVDDSFSIETVYGLSPKDKQALQAFRRTRK